MIPGGVPALSVFAFPVEEAANVALASAALLFVVTFGVAPFFRDSLREGESPSHVLEVLKQRNLASISPSVASSRWRFRSIIVDVRPKSQFDAAHPPHAISLPLYRPIQVRDIFSFARQLAFAFFGSQGSELDPEFESSALAQLPARKELIVACAEGGSLRNYKVHSRGLASRSLKACKKLTDLGFTNVKHLEGGLRQWEADGLPLVGTEDDNTT